MHYISCGKCDGSANSCTYLVAAYHRAMRPTVLAAQYESLRICSTSRSLAATLTFLPSMSINCTVPTARRLCAILSALCFLLCRLVRLADSGSEWISRSA